MEKEFLNGQMAENILVSGLMESKRELGHLYVVMVLLGKGNGEMVRKLNGKRLINTMKILLKSWNVLG